MSTDGGFLLSAEAIAQLKRTQRAVEKLTRGGMPEESPVSRFGPRIFRWARTGANSLCGNYPARPANTFPITFGELEYDNTQCGNLTRTFVAYDPPLDRIAHDAQDNYYPANSLVPVFLSHDRWYIASSMVEMFAEAELDEDMCPVNVMPDNETVAVANAKILPNCEVFTPTVTNPRRHRGKAGHKVLLIKKKCSVIGTGSGAYEGSGGEISAEEWQIFDVQLRRYCAVVGLDDRTACLVSGALMISGEWCPDDEPTVACQVVPYTDCDTSLGSCDLSWTFDAEYACCWLGSGS